MLTVVDEDIPDAREVFGLLGDVRLVRGREMAGHDVADADALIVRSVTRVDAALLAGSRVRFVGTVTSGADHVDADYLAASGIAFASAAGCNSVTVAEYVLAAILLLAERRGFDPRGRTLGVVGVGRIGSIVARWGQALGMIVLRYDPPLQRSDPEGGYVDFAALADADIVTVHVPLTRQGPDRTAGMVDARWLATLKKRAILINTSRGEVVCEPDLLAAIRGDPTPPTVARASGLWGHRRGAGATGLDGDRVAGRLGAAVLDVWCGEPDIDAELVEAVDVATPHVAGYSVEARRRGVSMIFNALVEFVGHGGPTLLGGRARARAATDQIDRGGAPLTSAAADVKGWRAATDGGRDASASPSPAIEGTDIIVSPGGPWYAASARAVLAACPLAEIDAQLRRAAEGGGVGRAFDSIRKTVSARREFAAYTIRGLPAGHEAGRFLRSVGFAGLG